MCDCGIQPFPEESLPCTCKDKKSHEWQQPPARKREVKSDFKNMLCGHDGRLSLKRVLMALSFLMVCSLSAYQIITQKQAQSELILPFTTILGLLGVGQMAQASYDYRTEKKYAYEMDMDYRYGLYPNDLQEGGRGAEPYPTRWDRGQAKHKPKQGGYR